MQPVLPVPSIPPCPACGRVETREVFQSGIYIALGLMDRVVLSAVICLYCGYTEFRPNPEDMDTLRQAVAKRGY